MLGREKADEKVKLKELHEYWYLFPIKWQEVNKSIHLDHSLTEEEDWIKEDSRGTDICIYFNTSHGCKSNI